MPINSEMVLRKMNEIQSSGGQAIGHWHSLRKWLLEPEQLQENFLDAVMNDNEMTHEQKEYWKSQSVPSKYGRQDVKGVYCRNCCAVIGFGEMKPYRKDDDTVDMLCSGCDSVLVEGE